MFAGELIRSRPLLYLTNLTNPHDADIVSNIFGVSHLCATVGIEQIKRINFLTIPKLLNFLVIGFPLLLTLNTVQSVVIYL